MFTAQIVSPWPLNVRCNVSIVEGNSLEQIGHQVAQK